MNLKNLGIWNIPESVKHLAKPAMQAQIERERQIIEIVTITDMPTDAVIEFLDNSRYDYDIIRQGLLVGASLDDDSIMTTLVRSTIGGWTQLSDLNLKKTFTDYLSDIPFYIGFWLAYLFMWLIYWFKEGVLTAKEEIWD